MAEILQPAKRGLQRIFPAAFFRAWTFFVLHAEVFRRIRKIAGWMVLATYFGGITFLILRGGMIPGFLSPYYVGRWHRTGGKAVQPMELNIRFQDNQVQFRSWDEQFGGVNTITFRCDGAEHLYRREGDGPTTYRARCDADSISLIKHEQNWNFHSIYDESWTATDHGGVLTYKRDDITATYDRFSFWRGLTTNAP